MIKELALEINGKTIAGPPDLRNSFQDLGSFLSAFFPIIIYISGVLLLFWGFWGVFQYLFAGGNKESIAKARTRITYAFVGFLIVAVSFALYQYLRTIYPQVDAPLNVRQVTTPPPISR